MTVSSRTPEGWPGHCVLCGNDFLLEFSDPGNDATCPNCGHLISGSADLLDEFKSIFERRRGVLGHQIDSSREFSTMGIDSLDTVELVMQIEEEFGVSISEDDAAKIQTIGDAIRYILEQRRRQNGM
jgi:acyl carrier protein